MRFRKKIDVSSFAVRAYLSSLSVAVNAVGDIVFISGLREFRALGALRDGRIKWYIFKDLSIVYVTDWNGGGSVGRREREDLEEDLARRINYIK